MKSPSKVRHQKDALVEDKEEAEGKKWQCLDFF